MFVCGKKGANQIRLGQKLSLSLFWSLVRQGAPNDVLGGVNHPL